jgi:hypothetical protein
MTQPNHKKKKKHYRGALIAFGLIGALVVISLYNRQVEIQQIEDSPSKVVTGIITKYKHRGAKVSGSFYFEYEVDGIIYEKKGGVTQLLPTFKSYSNQEQIGRQIYIRYLVSDPNIHEVISFIDESDKDYIRDQDLKGLPNTKTINLNEDSTINLDKEVNEMLDKIKLQ